MMASWTESDVPRFSLATVTALDLGLVGRSAEEWGAGELHYDRWGIHSYDLRLEVHCWCVRLVVRLDERMEGEWSVHRTCL